MLEEYAYDEDNMNPDLDILLRADVQTRPHQDKALGKMFCNSRARSGVIVLPCGAGKTLTGISAACTIHKSTLVVCSNTVACTQWKKEFERFTTLAPGNMVVFTSDVVLSEMPIGAMVLFTTYSMIGMKDENRASESRDAMEKIRSREWGLLVLDEVHMAPADTFRLTIDKLNAHCKLGLTATLVREDDQIGDLNYLVGPKLYEADWMDLTSQGYIAKVQCVEVLCPMTPIFMDAYIRDDKQSVYIMNPNKFLACRFLMEYHERQNEKILIFSDTVATVEEYATKLRRYCMYGKTKTEERNMLLARFRLRQGDKLWDPNIVNKEKDGKEVPRGNWVGAIQTLVLSKVGDVAIDLPEASVVIQVSSHFASRRQEAQRVGRILRPKQTRALFYSLVSMDTKEAMYNQKRKQFLMQQGYPYKSITWEMLFENQATKPTMEEAEQRRFLEIAKTDKLKAV
jgi:DNA excision repair protein ERCC-3